MTIRTLKTMLTSLCALFLCCCSDCEDAICATVTYEVDGTEQNVSVRYHDEYASEIYHSSIATPWIKKFTIKYRSEEYYGGGAPRGDYPAYISATAMYGSGHVVVRIYVEGELVREVYSSATDPTATARYAVHW